MAVSRRAEAHIRRHGREPNRSMSFVPQKHEQVPKVYRIYPGVVSVNMSCSRNSHSRSLDNYTWTGAQR
jgi:hypothetical protein